MLRVAEKIKNGTTRFPEDMYSTVEIYLHQAAKEALLKKRNS